MLQGLGCCCDTTTGDPGGDPQPGSCACSAKFWNFEHIWKIKWWKFAPRRSLLSYYYPFAQPSVFTRHSNTVDHIGNPGAHRCWTLEGVNNDSIVAKPVIIEQCRACIESLNHSDVGRTPCYYEFGQATGGAFSDVFGPGGSLDAGDGTPGGGGTGGSTEVTRPKDYWNRGTEYMGERLQYIGKPEFWPITIYNCIQGQIRNGGLVPIGSGLYRDICLHHISLLCRWPTNRFALDISVGGLAPLTVYTIMANTSGGGGEPGSIDTNPDVCVGSCFYFSKFNTDFAWPGLPYHQNFHVLRFALLCNNKFMLSTGRSSFGWVDNDTGVTIVNREFTVDSLNPDGFEILFNVRNQTSNGQGPPRQVKIVGYWIG